MPASKIIEHEDQHQQHGFVAVLGGFWLRRGFGPVPDLANAQGVLLAQVNHGRWIAECPAQGCGGASVVTARVPYMLCIECGSPENGGNWYHLVFPPNKTAIEQALLRRPVTDERGLSSRNWLPWETIEDLRAENRAHGLEVT